jgi:hypothetical protein
MKHTDHADFENWLRRITKNQPEPEVSSEFLASQRRSIYRRLDEPRRNWAPMSWALSLAMLLLMFAGGLTLERRHKTAPPASAAMSDDQLFSDLSAIEQRSEPKAIQPIHGLFQE